MSVRSRKRLGDILVESGALTQEQLAAALKEHDATSKRLGNAIVSLGYMTEEELMYVLSRQTGAPVVDPEFMRPEMETLRLTPEAMARKYVLLPISISDGELRVVMADPLNIVATDELSARYGMPVEPLIASEKQILAAITKYYEQLSTMTIAAYSVPGAEQAKIAEVPGETYDAGAPIAKLVDAILRQGVRDGASDIHIEPDEDVILVRYRIDGVMTQGMTPARTLGPAIISRIKIIAKLDIAETRAPQDGRFQLDLGGVSREFRVSTFPTIYGECAVIRVLNRSDVSLELSSMGLRGATLVNFRKAISSPLGMVIVTGPTGSGKTTTLYAALSAISDPARTIITIEDPVEYRLNLIRQTQINPKAGLTFASGLRSVLRQDPDVIMVGEIRDKETAETATQAAMTGHLVLTTLHTTDAAQGMTRMMDFGVEPYKIASVIRGVLAQRLVRKICASCGTGTGGRGTGCAACRQTGYSGRTGVFEFIANDEKMRELIMTKPPAAEITALARKAGGMETMYEDAMKKVSRGITTEEEVARAGLVKE